jgi:magnesium transporter
MIVDCAVYVGGERQGGTIGLAEVSRWIGQPGTFVWVGLRMPDRDEMAEVCGFCGLGDIDVDDAVAPHERPVVTIEEGVTWLVLRTARYNDELEEVSLGELSVMFTEHLVVTVRYGQASPLDGVRRELQGDPEALALGPAAVVAAIVERVVDDYRPTVDGFEHDVIEVEREVFAETRRRPVSRLYHLKRQVLELYVVIDAMHDPLARVARTNRLMHHPEVVAVMQVAGDELNRIVARIHTLSDLITTAIDANMTQVSLQQNEDMRRISAWVAIAAVPTMIAGIYGMNFEQMPALRAALPGVPPHRLALREPDPPDLVSFIVAPRR